MRPLLFFVLAAAPVLAETFPSAQWFRVHLGSPSLRVDLQAPAHISDHIVDGKLELSLRAYTELVLENNTDIALAKLQVLTPANSIMRAFGAFDPLLQASFNNTRSTQPTTSALQGAPTLRSLSQPVNFSYQQLLPSGSTLSVGFDAQRDSSNNAFSTYNPALSSNLAVAFDQPLLRNRGGAVARRTILIARSNLRISRHQLRDQVSTLLAAAENAYWDVVEA